MDEWIRVRYRNNREGLVDDVTLNELIIYQKIKQFYRPSEKRWVNIETDPVRRVPRLYNGSERRKRKGVFGETYRELLFRYLKGEDPKRLTAQEWFEKGFALLFDYGQYEEATRAFACAIRLDPLNARAYLDRGMAYEKMGNVEQALVDYGRAIELLPEDAKAYYIRGLIFRRMGKHPEAKEDLTVAAELGYTQARDILKSENLSRPRRW